MAKNNNFNNIGKDIEKALTDGLVNGDWSKLGSTISGSVDTVLDEVGNKVVGKFGGAQNHPNAKPLSSHHEAYSNGAYTRARQQKLEEEKRARQEAAKKKKMELQKEQARREAIEKAKNPGIMVPMNNVGGYSSIICMAAGGIGTAFTVVSLLKALPALIGGTAAMTGVIISGVFFAVFAGVLNKGLYDYNRLKRAQRYAACCGKREYAEIDELVASTGRSRRKILRDIKKMLGLGFFPQGHLDSENKNLILTDRVYNQYIETKRSAKAAEAVDTTSREVIEEYPDLSPEDAAELKQMVAEGTEYINKLHELNALIPGEVITAKLTRLEGLLQEIFARVREHPEQMGKMHELMDYYLPTMIKIVSAYEEYDKVSEPGQDIIHAKKDIEDTLDTINEAFRKLLNNLFKDSVWDVTTDAQVLKTLLAQKGLATEREGE